MLERITNSRLGKALTLATALTTLPLVGCEQRTSVIPTDKPDFKVTSIYATISGIPLSVEQNPRGYGTIGRIATILDINGNKIFAYNSGTGSNKYLDATVIIQSEMNDGDNEKIELTGQYESPTTFKMKSVRANGLEVIF
ncbi:MAG TPA: hypothetical protein VJJ23_02500 [Candidatus Nanoarchaeia archaeon]|nr:hypothetical protein [Candidatus Nanoarchaeia archaeon]